MLPTSTRSSGLSPTDDVGAPDGLRHDLECVARGDHDSLKWSRTTLAIVGSSKHRERENVSAGRGKTVGVRCAPSPIATTRCDIR